MDGPYEAGEILPDAERITRRVAASSLNGGLHRVRRHLSLLVPLLSVGVTAAVFICMFSPGRVIRAIQSANIGLIVLAFLSGILIEVIKARRVSLMLSRSRPVTMGEAFGIDVVSHGIGHLVPVAPTTMALRSLLANRIKAIPLLFSAGVFLAADVLDNTALLPLVAYLLTMVALPVWQRVLLGGLLVQGLIFVIVPFLGGSAGAFLSRVSDRRLPGWLVGVVRAVESTASGMASVATGGWTIGSVLAVLTLSAVMVGMLRLELLLHAFGLDASWTQLCWLMILSSLVGKLPIAVPGAGVWAATRALKVAAITGPGVGGYVLVLRTISSIETPLLALGVLLWWSMPGSSSTIRASDLRQLWRGLRLPDKAHDRCLSPPASEAGDGPEPVFSSMGQVAGGRRDATGAKSDAAS